MHHFHSKKWEVNDTKQGRKEGRGGRRIMLDIPMELHNSEVQVISSINQEFQNIMKQKHIKPLKRQVERQQVGAE